MRAISPNTGAPETVIAEDQLEYQSLVAAMYQDSTLESPVMLTRWTMTDEERLAIARGEDIFVAIVTFSRPLQPLQVLVGPQYYQLTPKE